MSLMRRLHTKTYPEEQLLDEDCDNPFHLYATYMDIGRVYGSFGASI